MCCFFSINDEVAVEGKLAWRLADLVGNGLVVWTQVN